MSLAEQNDLQPVGEDPPEARVSTTFIPEHSLPHAFSVVSNRVSRMLERMYGESFGISVVDWRVIAILGTHSPLSAKALAQLTAMDQVSVSRAIESLTTKKLVVRRTDVTDRRRVALRLSKNGVAIYNQVTPLLYAAEEALISRLTAEDAATIRRVMDVLVEASGELFDGGDDWRTLLDGD